MPYSHLYLADTRSLIRCQVHKVRFVASTLLDAVRKPETAPATAARAHAYLCSLAFARPMTVILIDGIRLLGDFLSILSEIERNYLYVSVSCAHDYLTSVDDSYLFRLDDDRDATSNGDGMTTLMSNN
jgi:hypothetical protein